MRTRKDRLGPFLSTLGIVSALGAGPLLAGAPYVGLVKGSEVKIRTGGSQNHHAFAAVKMGQRVLVDREVNGWCRIHVPRWIPLYVHKDYLNASGTRGTVKAGELNIRVAPQRAHESVGSLQAGSEVEILGREGDWLKIVPPHTAFAYLSQRYITRERDVATAEVPRQLSLLSETPDVAIVLSARADGGPSVAGSFSTPPLRRAQELLQSVAARDPASRDYAASKALYQEVANSSEDRTEIAAAEEGLRKIEALESHKALLLNARQSIADVERKNQELEERVRLSRLSARSGRGGRAGDSSDTYLARGWVTGLGRFNGQQQGSHRLMKGSQVLYFLQSEDGKAIPLDTYLNKRVGVKGVIRELDPRFGANLIVVSEITVLSEL